MLGSPTRSLDEIFERLDGSAFTAEFKYDGQRAQIHAWVDDGKTAVKVFSRHLEDMTEKVTFLIACMNRRFSKSY
jgi:DNA ligase-1